MKILKLINSQNLRISAIGSLVVKFLSAVFAFGNGILLARIMSLNSYGIYVLALTTINVLSVPVSLGLPFMITRYVSKYNTHRQIREMKGLLIRTNQIVVGAFILILIVAYISYLLWWKNLQIDLVQTIWYSFILLPLISLTALRAATLRGLKFVFLGQLPGTLLRTFLLFSFISIYFLMGAPVSPQKAMILNIFAAMAAFLCTHIFLNIKLLKKIKDVKPLFYNKLWLKEAIPFSLNGGILVIRSRLTTYILAAFGNAEAVAIFDIAYRGANLVSFTLDAINTGISPFISSAFELNDKKVLQRIVTKASRIVFLTSLPVAFVFIFWGKPLLSQIFGIKYISSYLPLAVLCLGELISALVGSVGLVLNMTGHQLYFTKNNMVMALLTIVFAIPTVYYFGVVGAAITISSIVIIQNLTLFFYVKRKLNITTHI